MKSEDTFGELMKSELESFKPWTSVLTQGQRMSKRAYFAHFLIDGILHIQGGIDHQTGIMGDLLSINVLKLGCSFEQQKVICQGFSQKLLTLYRHRAVAISEDKVVIFGGKACTEGSTNNLIVLTRGDTWKATLLTGGNLNKLPCLDSHSIHCVGEYLYIFGGFESLPTYSLSNRMFRVDLEKQMFEKVQIDGYLPEPRMNFGSCLDLSSRLIILGGAGHDKKFADLFRFDFVAKKWKKLASQTIAKGIEGHQIVYNRFLENFIVFGGVHEASDENRNLIGIDDYGNASFLSEINETSGSPLLKERYRTNKTVTRSFSRVSDIGKSKFKDGKTSTAKRFFLESDIERKFYDQEFVLHSEKERSELRHSDKAVEAMKQSLFLFGTFKSESHMYKLLAEEKFKDMPEKKQHGDESEQELLKQAFLKESNRPIPREGHIMFVLRDKLIIVGGMRHTLAFNDISYIACSSLQVDNKENFDSLNNQDIILDPK